MVRLLSLALVTALSAAFDQKGPGLDNFGPFKLTAVALYPRDFQFRKSFEDSDGRDWSIIRPLRGNVREIIGENANVTGHLSPVHRVTLDGETRGIVGIVPEAAYFAFSYPSAVGIDAPVTWGDMADVAFLLIGGFIYFDEDQNLVQVMAFVPSSKGLTFNPQQAWLPEWTAELGTSRFQTVVLPHQKAAGAKYFAWLPPGAENVQLEVEPDGTLMTKIKSWFGLDNGSGPAINKPDCEHGCFAFLFDDISCDDGTACQVMERSNKSVYFSVQR